MLHHISRRGFLATSAAATVAPLLPGSALSQVAALSLTAGTRTIDIDGRAATVYGLTNQSGGSGLVLDPGQRFRVDLTNTLDIETIIHWHGQMPPNVQDGVPDLPMPKLATGETRSYDYAPQPGTHWMHSHIPVQEMQLLAAPLIVRTAEEAAADRQEVVMFLHDFSFTPPEEVLEQITGGIAHGMDHSAPMRMGDMADMDHSAMEGMGDMAGMDHSAMEGMGDMAGMDHSAMEGMGDMAGMVMDLNDFDFDAYLVNDRTLSDPEVIQVEPGGRVRLRIINASAATTYWIDTGAVGGTLVAVDGHPIQPKAGGRFGIAMAQRLDIDIDLPPGQGAFPVLALREGARERTGLILATPGATVPRLSGMSDMDSPAFDIDLAQEMSLRAAMPLPVTPATRFEMIMLNGAMQPYLWTINGRSWEDRVPITATSGDRIELMFHNMSMMGHPMHLHGHAFQVVEVNGQRFSGAVRDTVYVPPMAMVTIAVDPGEAARWMLHCHHMPHLSTGMMTEFAVQPRDT
jgi:FtsP/CotA-like multicopper oxidase with cupredoxin domain